MCHSSALPHPSAAGIANEKTVDIAADGDALKVRQRSQGWLMAATSQQIQQGSRAAELALWSNSDDRCAECGLGITSNVNSKQ